MNTWEPIGSSDDSPKEVVYPDVPRSGYYLRPEKLDEFTFALSDFLCWIDGFRAGGGTYSPDSQESLRNLNDALKSLQTGQARSCLSHSQPPKK